MEDGLALFVGEVHVVKSHVSGELHQVVVLPFHIPNRALDQPVEYTAPGLGILPGPGGVLLRGFQLGNGTVLPLHHRDHHGLGAVGDLPGPKIGPLVGLLQLAALFVVGHVHQGNHAVILLGGLIHQIEDSLCARQCHDHRVELLGDLADGVGEALGQLEEGGNGTQSNAGVNTAQSQRTAGHGHDHVLDVADVDQNGHEDVGVLVGLVGALTQGIVHPVEARLGLFLVAEYLNHLLAVDHLFDIAVQITQLHLLLDEVAAAAAGQEAGHTEHDEDAHNHHSGKQQIGGQHAHEGDQNHHGGVDHLGNALGEHLTQGVHVVGINAHHIAVGMGVKILDGQGLHVAEQIITDALLHALGNGDHDPVVGKSTQSAHNIQAGHHENDSQQAAEVRVVHGQQGRDIVVDQVAQEQGAGHGGHRADQNAQNDHHKQGQVAAAHVAEQSADHMFLIHRGLIHSRRPPSSGIHRFHGRYHRSGAAPHGYPWRRSFRRPSPESYRHPR